MSLLSFVESFAKDFPTDWKSFEDKITALQRSAKLEDIKPYFLQVWESVLHDREAMDIYEAVFRLFDAANRIVLPEPVTPTKTTRYNDTADTEGDIGDALLKHWNSPYIGPSCRILQEMIRQYEQEDCGTYYTKSLLFVQSSGTGKSRLADAFGKGCPMVNYVIRKENSGFPLRDPEILEFMQLGPTVAQQELMKQSPFPKSLPEREQEERISNTWFHALSIGILQATFEICKISFPLSSTST
jgi:hypothetical protein